MFERVVEQHSSRDGDRRPRFIYGEAGFDATVSAILGGDWESRHTLARAYAVVYGHWQNNWVDLKKSNKKEPDGRAGGFTMEQRKAFAEMAQQQGAVKTRR
jgi:hypothetical protein